MPLNNFKLVLFISNFQLLIEDHHLYPFKKDNKTRKQKEGDEKYKKVRDFFLSKKLTC